MLLAIHLLLIPFLGALLVLFSGKRLSAAIALIVSIISFFYCLTLLSFFHAEKQAQFGTLLNWVPGLKLMFHLGLDGYSTIPLVLSQLVVCLSLLASIYFKQSRSPLYYALILFTLTALNGFFTAQNPLTFYLFFELALIPAFFLVLLWGGTNKNKAVFKFFIYTVFGGFVMLAAIIYLQYKSGQVINSWHDFYSHRLSILEQKWLLLAFFIAFAIKSPIFPFHTWQADLYAEGDRPSIMIIAGVLSKMGIFGLLRFNYVFYDALQELAPYLIGLCIVGIIYGALMAWKQKEMSRLLAYSSLSHMGMIAAAALLMQYYSVQGAMFQMLVHGICVAGLFFVVEVLQRRSETNLLDGTQGMARVLPRLSVYYFIIVLASIGLPLTAGFIGEFYILYGLTEYNIYFGFIAGISIILGAVYMLLFYQKSMFGVPSEKTKLSSRLNLSEEYILLIIVFLLVALGFFPKQWMELSHYAYMEYVDYIIK